MYNLKGLQKNQNFETLLKDILKTCNIYNVYSYWYQMDENLKLKFCQLRSQKLV